MLGGSRVRTSLRGPDWQQILNQEELSIPTAPAEIRRDDSDSVWGKKLEAGEAFCFFFFFSEMKFEPQSGREVEVGGTALSTWLLLLFSTQLKGECSLIWTRGEEKRSGTGIWQEGAGKQRERHRGESGQSFALPREVFAARPGRSELGWNKALLFLASGGPVCGPPRPAELAEVFGSSFPGRLLAGGELRVLGCTQGTG